MSQADKVADLEVTAEELAGLAGITARHVRRLVGSLKVGRNSWRLGEAFQALLEAMSSGDRGGELLAARIRKLNAEATMAELALAKARGEVAPLAEVERGWLRSTTIIRANVLNVVQRAAPQLLGERDEAIFKERLRAELVLALQQAADAEILELDIKDDQTDDE